MKIVICDDNKNDREKYAAFIESILLKHGMNSNLEVIRFSSADALLFAMEDTGFDVQIVFLDICMQGIDGMEAARIMRDKYKYKYEIVFITNSAEYILDAFEVDAINYLIKGQFTMQKFEQVLLKACGSVTRKSQEYALFTRGGDSMCIALSDIRYFEVQKDIVTVHYDEGGTFDFVSTLSRIENDLGKKGFVRIHRSYMVAIRYVATYSFKNVGLIDGTVLPVGRTHYEHAKKVLEQRNNKSGIIISNVSEIG